VKNWYQSGESPVHLFNDRAAPSKTVASPAKGAV